MDSFDRTVILIPVAIHIGTISFESWPRRSRYDKPSFISLGCLRTHPAAFRTLSISFVNGKASSSCATLIVYSIPVKGRRPLIKSAELNIDRGVFRRFNSSSALTACFVAFANCCFASANFCSALAKRDTASAASFFADAISLANESASCLAPCARPAADALDTFAASDSSFARAADCAASPDCFVASAEVRWASPRSASLMLSSSSLLVFTLPSNQNSPATPTTIMSHPTNPAHNIHLGISGRWNLNGPVFSRSSPTISKTSRNTPITTRTVDAFSRVSSSCRNRSSTSLTNGARAFAISGSFPEAWVERDIADEIMFEKIMVILVCAFVVLLAWRFIRWPNRRDSKLG